jgi:hypothetical protein
MCCPHSQTANLDGETNLKRREAPKPIAERIAFREQGGERLVSWPELLGCLLRLHALPLLCLLLPIEQEFGSSLLGSLCAVVIRDCFHFSLTGCG